MGLAAEDDCVGVPMLNSLFSGIEDRRDEMIALRRELHAHPELAFKESRTAARVASMLESAGLDVRTGVAGTGVVGVLRGARPGPAVMVRADIDAIAVDEANEVPYRSQTPGVMHACGHDGHTAIAAVLAGLFAAHRSEIGGSVVFAFQPAEEAVSGALPMIEAGTMDDPRVDCVIGLHLWNEAPVGRVGVRAGPLFASADEITIEITGRGGHGAVPHRAIDPIAAAAYAITGLQTLVSRETAPLDSAVVTIGSIHAGTAFNIIPERVEMRGTVRAFKEEVREHTLRRMREIVSQTAAALRAQATINSRFGCPPVVNDAGVTETVRQAAVEAVGPEAVFESDPTMGSDDMAYFLQRAPGCYFVVGSRNEERGLTGAHHNPRFDFDEEAMVVGARVLAAAAVRLLGR